MNRRPHRERGVAVIEMAFVLWFSITVLAMIVLVGRLTWHAVALTKAVANTSRIVATLPSSTLTGDQSALEVLARKTLSDATRAAGLDLQPAEDAFELVCLPFGCNRANSTSVTVAASIDFRDTIFDSQFDELIPALIPIDSSFTQSYATTFPPVPTNN